MVLFFLIFLTIQYRLGLKVRDLKKKNVTQGGGGGGKVQKNVTSHLKYPINLINYFYDPPLPLFDIFQFLKSEFKP